MNDNSSRFESLSNELLLDLFDYIDIHDLYAIFWGLNLRLNNLLRSLKNLSLVVSKDETLLINVFAHQIILLESEYQCHINLNEFTNLRWLTLKDATEDQVAQIRSERMPSLVYLSLSVEFYCTALDELVDEVFSNGFPSLRHVHLGNFDHIEFPRSWSQSPRLHSICIFNIQSDIVPSILASCPNLRYLKVHLADDDDDDFHTTLSPPPTDHLLKKFILSADSDIWHYTDIDTLLTYMPNVEWINFEFWYGMSILNLMYSIAHRLPRLNRFDCWLTGHYDNNKRKHVDIIRSIHPCFSRMDYMPGPDDYLEFYQ